MRAVVVGGTGFLGGAIVDELLGRGHEVAAVSPSAPPVGSGQLHLFSGDLAEPESFLPVLDGADVVVLATGRTVPGNARAAAASEVWSQVHGTLAVIDHLDDVAPDAQLVYLSSAGGLASGSTAFAEDGRPRPWSTYGALKVAVEAFIDARNRELGRSCLIIRPSNPYGPGQRLDKPQGFIAQACAAVAADRPVELWDPLTTERDWIYVDDFSRCVVAAIGAGLTGPLHVGAGEQRSLQDVLDVIAAVSGRRIETVVRPRSGSATPTTLPVAVERARHELGWEPTVDLDEGVARLWESLAGAGTPERSGLDVREPLRR